MDQVVYFHLPVNDMERANKFYSDIFGWEITEIPEHTQYQMVKTVETDENEIPLEPGAINGSLYVRESPEDYPEITIEVSSIDTYLKKIQKSGGKIITPRTAAGDMGFYAEFIDPEGNVMGLWEEAK